MILYYQIYANFIFIREFKEREKIRNMHILLKRFQL